MKKKLPKGFYLAMTVLSLIAVAGIYLGVAYKMRDVSEGWCEMSFGYYMEEVDCSLGGGKLTEKETSCVLMGNYLCSQGIFNPSGGRHDRTSLSKAL